MNDNRFFADVDLPFHVWMREGNRWVLRAAPQGDAGEGAAKLAAPQCTDAAAPETRRAA